MAEPGPQQRQIIQEFNAKRQRLQDVARKVEELNAEANEHDMVIKALQPMAPTRKCFRLIGDVLVERTVGETLPAVTRNKDNLEVAVKTLSESMADLENQLSEMQTKYKIKLVDRQGRPVEPDQGEEATTGKGGEKGSQAGGGAGSSSSGKKGGVGVLA